MHLHMAAAKSSVDVLPDCKWQAVAEISAKNNKGINV